MSGISPHLFPPQIRLSPDFLDDSALDSAYLTDGAQRNLPASQEYQSSLDQINAIAGGVIAKSIRREHRESLNNPDRVDTAPDLGDLPSPGQKRTARFGQGHSAAKKRPLEISHPSSPTTSLRDGASFQQQLAVSVKELSGEISLRSALKSFSHDDVRFQLTFWFVRDYFYRLLIQSFRFRIIGNIYCMICATGVLSIEIFRSFSRFLKPAHIRSRIETLSTRSLKRFVGRLNRVDQWFPFEFARPTYS